MTDRATTLGDALAALVDARVDERLRALGVGAGAVTYRSDARLPSGEIAPGVRSREHFGAVCRTLGIGRREGRVWSVSASEWAQGRRRARSVAGTGAEKAGQGSGADQLLAANPRLRLIGP